jgi:hypothetical protein
VNVDLFLKRVPAVVKELIGREAAENRRSVNQEAIALLEEALIGRVEIHQARRRTALETLRSYADSRNGGLDGAVVATPPPLPADRQ